jgi:hypothetical protein
MNASDQFNLSLAKIRKQKLPPEEHLKAIRSSFCRSLDVIPQTARQELFDFYQDRLESTEGEDLHAWADHLLDIIDLFDRSYDDQRDPLDEEEWDLIQDVVSDCAGIMDEDVLLFIMQRIVDRGRLG